MSVNDNILIKIASYMIPKTLTFRESTQNYQTQKEISCSIFRLPPKVANKASPQVTTFRQERACLATVTSMWRQWIYWRNVSSGNNAHVTGSEKKAGKYFLVWNVDGYFCFVLYLNEKVFVLLPTSSGSLLDKIP